MTSKAAKALNGVDLKGKTAVVTGGTNGIGASVAIRFSELGCSKIVIVGRDGKQAQVVLAKIKAASPRHDVEAKFVQGDLELVKGMKDTAKAMEEAAGPDGIDYLIETHGPIPCGTLTDTAEGIERDFAIQSLSRFAMAYLPALHGALKPGAGVINVFSAGRGLPDLDVEDLYLRKKYEAGKKGFGFMMQKSQRNSCVIDCFTEELNRRYPQQRFYNMHPGIVKTDNFIKEAARWSFPMNYIGWALLKFFGTDPVAYSNVPIYFAATPEPEKNHPGVRFFDQSLKPVKIGDWAADDRNREKMWEKLRELLGE